MLEQNNDAEHNKKTQITLQIVEPKRDISINEIENEITETLTDNENDDSEPWENDIYKP